MHQRRFPPLLQKVRFFHHTTFLLNIGLSHFIEMLDLHLWCGDESACADLSFRITVPVCETGSSHSRARAPALSRGRARRYRILPRETRGARQAGQPVHLWGSWNREDGLLELCASRTQGELLRIVGRKATQ